MEIKKIDINTMKTKYIYNRVRKWISYYHGLSKQNILTSYINH